MAFDAIFSAVLRILPYNVASKDAHHNIGQSMADGVLSGALLSLIGLDA